MFYFIAEKKNLPNTVKKLLYLTDESTVESCESNELSLALHFLSNICTSFEAASKTLQNEATVASQLYDVMTKFVKQLENRLNDQFYGAFTNRALKQLDENTRRDMKNQFKLFLETAINYCKKWFNFSEDNPLFIIKPISLENELCFDDLTTIVEKLKLGAVDIDCLYEEFSTVKDVIQHLIEEQELTTGENGRNCLKKRNRVKNPFQISVILSKCTSLKRFCREGFSPHEFKMDGHEKSLLAGLDKIRTDRVHKCP